MKKKFTDFAISKNKIHQLFSLNIFNKIPLLLLKIFLSVILSLCFVTAMNAATFYLTAAGAGAAQTQGSWNTMADGSGIPAIYGDFSGNNTFIIPVGINGVVSGSWSLGNTGANITTILTISGQLTINDYSTLTLRNNNSGLCTMTVTGGGKIIFSGTGANQLVGSGTLANNVFNLWNNATLITANASGIVSNNGTCSINSTSVTTTFDYRANYEFNGAAQTMTGIPATVRNLTFSGTGTKTMLYGEVINGNFTNGAGVTIITGNYPLTLGGNFTNNGVAFDAGNSAITMNSIATQNIASFNTSGTVSMTKPAGTATLNGTSGDGALTINGTGGTLNLGTSSHTFTSVTITAGTLTLGGNDLLATPNFILNGGTLNTAGFNESVGTLRLTANSTINLGATVHSLRFSDSNSESWTTNTILTVTGWSGPSWDGSSGDKGKLFVGNSSMLAPGQSDQISFFNGSSYYSAAQLADKEVVPGGTISGLSYNTPNTFYLGVAISTLSPTITGTPDSYSITGLPAGLNLNGANGSITGTPTGGISGPTTYTVTATKGSVSITFPVDITIAQRTFYSIASSNWTSNLTWSFSSGGSTVGVGVYPVANDAVVIEIGFNVLVTTNMACASVTFSGNGAAPTLTVTSPGSLTVSGAVTLNSLRFANNACTITGSGSLSCASVAVGSGVAPDAASTTIMTSDLTDFICSGNITLRSDRGGRPNNASFILPSGMVTASGITTDNTHTGNISTFNMASDPQTGTLNLSGATPFTISATGTSTITLNGTNATVNYNGAAQPVANFIYNNLIISGTSTKTLAGHTTVNRDLTVKANSTLALSTFALSAPTSVKLECGALTAGSSITGTGALTLGGDVAVTNVAAGKFGATIATPIDLGATRTFTVANDGTTASDLTISGIISSANGITKEGAGTMTLSGVNTYTGVTTINTGILSVGTIGNGGIAGNLGQATNAAGNLVLGGGTLQFAGSLVDMTDRSFTLTAGTTSNIDIVDNALFISGSSATTTGALTKTGNAGLILTGSILHTGATTITESFIMLRPTANITPATQFIMNGGVLSTFLITPGRTITNSETLKLNVSSTIGLNNNAHTLTFANSSGIAWPGAMLTITGWTGTIGSSGTGGQIFVGSSALGLDATQLAKIQFTIATVNYPATILSTGEVVPVACTTGTWTGAFDTDWNTAANWCGSVVPDSNTDVVIPSAPTNQPVISVASPAAVCKSLTINSGATLGISGSNTLDIWGDLTNNGGIITANSSTISLKGNWNDNSGTFNANTGTVNYNGNAQTVAALTYNNLTLSGAVSKTFPAGTTTVNGILSIENGTSANTFTGSLAYGATATLQYNTATIRTASTEWITPFVATGGVIIDGTGAIILDADKVFNEGVPLTIQSGARLNTSAADNYGLTFGGNYINNGGTLTANASPITIANTMVTQSISGFTTTGTVSMTKTAGTATFTGNVNVGVFTLSGLGGTLDLGSGFTHTFNGDVTLSAGTLNGGSSTLYVNSVSVTAWGGDGSLFTPGTSTVNLSGNQTISATTPVFNNLTLSGTGIITFSAITTINGDLSMSNPAEVNLSTFTSTASTITLDGSGQPSHAYGGTGAPLGTWIIDAYFYPATGVLNVGATCAGTLTTTFTTPICDGDGVTLTVTLTSGNSTNWSYIWDTGNATPQTTVNNVNGATSTISGLTPAANTTYRLYQITDGSACTKTYY